MRNNNELSKKALIKKLEEYKKHLKDLEEEQKQTMVEKKKNNTNGLDKVHGR